MKKVISVFVLLLGLMGLMGCSNVEPGYVGIKVYLLGGSKGVDHEVLGVGRYWIGMNEHLYLFPTFQQNVTWTKSPAEGKPVDESISFQTKEGMTVSADIGVSYSVNPEKVAVLFQKYRKGIDEITEIFLRNMVRDAFTVVASGMSVEDVYGEKKPELVKQAEDKVRKEVADIGLVIDKISLVGELRLPEQVIKSLNAKIQATQDAMRTHNEIESAKAQAEKDIAVARGVAMANQIKAASISDALIRWETIQKWDGHLSQVTGGNSMPVIDLSGKK